MSTGPERPGGRIVSFASPKGGAGRTMVMANLAAVYARGCLWAGLEPSAVLAADLDFQAPGLHFYDFASHFQGPLTLTVAGERAENWQEVRDQMKLKHIGILPWLEAILIDKRLAFGSRAQPSPKEVASIVHQIVRTCAPDDPVNPARHIIRLGRVGGPPPFLLLPAADPLQPGYRETLLGLDVADFFQRMQGFAILDALYAEVLSSSGAKDFAWRILLDQGGGVSVTSVANRAYADHHVVVGALNEQHRAGLSSFKATVHRDDASRVSVVISQYSARTLAIGSLVNRFEFMKEDKLRSEVRDEYVERGPFKREQFFVVDFEPAAVGKEHLFSSTSHSYDELVRLAIAIDRPEGVPRERNVLPSSSGVRELRVLGEVVGEQELSGALGGFTAWLRKTLPADCLVKAGATTHEDIVRLVQRTGTTGAGGDGKSGEPCDLDGIGIRRLDASKLSRARLSDFDLVAIPVSALSTDSLDQFEELAGFDGTDEVHSLDCWGVLTEEYVGNVIYGWKEYARFPDAIGRHRLVGYPLFVDHQLIVINHKNLEGDFVRQYRRLALRKFRGFADPADLLVAAEIGHATQSDADSLLMTLSPASVARWYEWRTLVAMFADPTGSYPIDGAALADATAHYLELCTFADPKSLRTDWDVMQHLFYRKNAVGMALIWPDAIPKEARSVDQSFEYVRPPGTFSHEECWLIVIPRHRAADRPSRAALEALLRRFLSDGAQQAYLEEGGLPVHRRVLRDPDNWRAFAFLPPLSRWPGDEPVSASEANTRLGLAQKEREVRLLVMLQHEREVAEKPLTRERILEVLNRRESE